MCITQVCAKADQDFVQKMWRDVVHRFERLVAPKQHFVRGHNRFPIQISMALL